MKRRRATPPNLGGELQFGCCATFVDIGEAAELLNSPLNNFLVIPTRRVIEYFPMSKPKPKKKLSRRKFLKGTGAALAVATTAPKIEAQTPVVTTSVETV